MSLIWCSRCIRRIVWHSGLVTRELIYTGGQEPRGKSSLPCSLRSPLVSALFLSSLFFSFTVLTLNNGIASRRQSLCIIHLALLYTLSCVFPVLATFSVLLLLLDFLFFRFLFRFVFSLVSFLFSFLFSSESGINREPKDRLKRRLWVSRLSSNFTDINSAGLSYHIEK